MTNLADAASRRLIEERLDLNLFVEAGAGSGKTESLARRMAAGVLSGRYHVEEMAAVTFTRKAAAELRGRFQKVLEEKLASAEGEVRDRIQRALVGLEHLFAGTIHSFCAHLLRERPVEAGIAPGFTELEELENDEFRQQAWRDYLARLRGAGSNELIELQRAGIRPKDLHGALERICTFDEVTFDAGDAQMPGVDEARKRAKALWESLRVLLPATRPADHNCKALERTYRFGACVRTIDRAPSDVARAVQCWEKLPAVTMKWWRLEAPEEQKVVREKVQKLIADFSTTTAVPFLAAWRAYVYRLAITVLAGARDYAREERRRALALNFTDLLTAAARLLRENRAVRRAMQRKYRWLFVDEFQDTDPIQAEVVLLLAAREQEESGPWPEPCHPYAVSLRPGALFVVGDPKQSIYRFRRADIDVYNRVRDVILNDGGQVVPLVTSFRARPVLCAWNNEVFAQLLPPVATSQQAAFRPLEPVPPDGVRSVPPDGVRSVLDHALGSDLGGRPVPLAVPDPGWGTEGTAPDLTPSGGTDRVIPDLTPRGGTDRATPDLTPRGGTRRTGPDLTPPGGTNSTGPDLTPPGGTDRITPDLTPPGGTHLAGDEGLRTLNPPADLGSREVREWEADAIARFIRAEVDAGRADWADFLVLTRKKRGHLTAYAEALRALDVPVDVPGDGALGQSPFVLALVKLLRALGDPGDTSALVAVLRGPLFGISDRELFNHRQGGRYFSIPVAKHKTGEADTAGRSKVERALAQLGSFLRLTRALPLPAAVDRILTDTGLVALAAASTPNAEPAATVMQVVDIVRAVAERGGTLADAAEALAHAAESEDAEAVALEPGRRNVVRVMNLHKAKGLEARIVFLADPHGTPQDRPPTTRIVRDGAVARGYVAISKKIGEHASEVIAQPTGWEKHQDEEAAYVKAEETRLLYVAATRAREMLVVTRGASGSKGRRCWQALDPFLAGAPELAVPTTKVARTLAKPNLSPAARKRAAAERARHFERVATPSWDITSMTGGEQLRAEENTGDSGATTAGGVAPNETRTLRADAGAAWGSLVHGLLEHAARHPGATREEFEHLARWLVFEAPELEPVLPQAVDVVMQLAASSWWTELRAGGELQAEVPFAVRLEPGQSLGSIVAGSRPTIVHGVIDLAHRTDPGWRILDYKTDLADDDAGLVGRHGAQLNIYRAAWERATAQPVTATAIVAVRKGKVVTV